MNSNLFYKTISKIYDLLDSTYFHNTNKSPRNAIFHYIEPDDVKILDVCTGTAANAIAIAKRNRKSQIIGIDLSKEMLQVARNKVRSSALDNLKLYHMDATSTQFKDNTFDVIIISLVLHEVSRELAGSILIEAKRILKPEGKLLVVEWEEPQTLLKKILFYPIKILEPKGFRQFLKLDMYDYFSIYDLEIKDIRHCDYSKVLCLKIIES